jgi:branched-chain amino acid transport system substrate-binding protein
MPATAQFGRDVVVSAERGNHNQGDRSRCREDAIAAIRSARTRHDTGPQIFAALAHFTNVAALGLETAQGADAEPFYWDLTTRRGLGRAVSLRVNKMPNSLQAGLLVDITCGRSPPLRPTTVPVMRVMRATAIDDFFAHDGHIRADGVMIDMRVSGKSPAGQYPWDYYRRRHHTGRSGFPAISIRCPLVKG